MLAERDIAPTVVRFRHASPADLREHAELFRCPIEFGAEYAEVEIETGGTAAVVAVPESALIDTGDRQVVIVDKGDGRFEPRDVKVGTRGEEATEIIEGVSEGERVVVSANFLIDAESNLKAALSAFAPAEEQP